MEKSFFSFFINDGIRFHNSKFILINLIIIYFFKFLQKWVTSHNRKIVLKIRLFTINFLYFNSRSLNICFNVCKFKRKFTWWHFRLAWKTLTITPIFIIKNCIILTLLFFILDRVYFFMKSIFGKNLIKKCANILSVSLSHFDVFICC